MNAILLPFEGQAMSFFSVFGAFKSKAAAALSSVFIPYKKEEVSLPPAPTPCEFGIRDLFSKPILKGFLPAFTSFKNKPTHSNLYVVGGALSAAVLLYLARPYISKFLSSNSNIVEDGLEDNDQVENGLEENNYQGDGDESYAIDNNSGEMYLPINDSSLHIAVRENDLTEVQSIICRGAILNINSLNSEKKTALGIAIENNYTNISIVLVAAGATSL